MVQLNKTWSQLLIGGDPLIRMYWRSMDVLQIGWEMTHKILLPTPIPVEPTGELRNWGWQSNAIFIPCYDLDQCLCINIRRWLWDGPWWCKCVSPWTCTSDWCSHLAWGIGRQSTYHLCTLECWWSLLQKRHCQKHGYQKLEKHQMFLQAEKQFSQQTAWNGGIWSMCQVWFNL